MWLIIAYLYLMNNYIYLTAVGQSIKQSLCISSYIPQHETYRDIEELGTVNMFLRRARKKLLVSAAYILNAHSNY
jgi:hypothetical protein